MTTPQSTRSLIVEKADSLFYQAGFDHTSLADIASLVGISRGNFYHHFKTKDEILEAVILKRRAAVHAATRQWEEASQNPLDRIKSYFSFFTVNKDKIKKYGCPMGTLTSEMRKLNHDAHADSLEVYTFFRNWLAHQFGQLGFSVTKADELALHLIMLSQGIATVFNAYQDEAFVKMELENAFNWLDTLTTK